MGSEWLTMITEILEGAGFRAGEEYPAGRFPEITEPVAAVGLRALNCADGEAVMSVRILSPRSIGGWACQSAAAEAVAALEKAGVRCQTGKMEHEARPDWFAICITAAIPVCREGGVWVAGGGWKIFLDGKEQSWVTEFTAAQDQDRRLIGSVSQAEPTGVTPGKGGWSVCMIQQVPPEGKEPAEPAEPFVLTASRGGRSHVYSGCCWNSVERYYRDDGIRVVRKGFALTREVKAVG